MWRVSEEHRKIVTILKNAPILDFPCVAGKLKNKRSLKIGIIPLNVGVKVRSHVFMKKWSEES